MIKDAKGKNVGKTIFIIFFHYFEEKFQYRIERSPVITGDLKIELKGTLFVSLHGVTVEVHSHNYLFYSNEQTTFIIIVVIKHRNT